MGYMKRYEEKVQKLCLDALELGAETDEDCYLYVKEHLKLVTLYSVWKVLNNISKNQGQDDR